MRSRWLYCTLFCFLSSLAYGGGSVDLGGEIRLPLPDGWTVIDESSGYPFQIVNNSQSAELLLFKSKISHSETLASEAEFKRAVDSVVQSVIMTLPESRLLTNTGYFDRKQAWFVLEFLTLDTTEGVPLRHRLKGVLYLHPDGYQLLFTIWARASSDMPLSMTEDFQLMQSGFAYTGPAEENVFETSSDKTGWYLTALIFLIVLVIYLRKRRSRIDRIAFSKEGNFWRCECGRLNHGSKPSCRRCGRIRAVNAAT